MRDFIKNLGRMPAFTTQTEGKVAHDLFIAREFHLQLVKLGEAYNRMRSDAGDGAFAATVRYAVQLGRGLGMSRPEFFAIAAACWEDR